MSVKEYIDISSCSRYPDHVLLFDCDSFVYSVLSDCDSSVLSYLEYVSAGYRLQSCDYVILYHKSLIA